MSNKAKKWQEGEYIIRVTSNHVTATKLVNEEKDFLNTKLNVTKAYKGVAGCDPRDEFDLGEGCKTAMNRLNLLLESKFDNKIKAGDFVKVVQPLKAYTTYCDWVDKYVTSSYDKCRYAFRTNPGNITGKVLYMGKHERGSMLAYIEDTNRDGLTTSCYLVAVEGLEKL